MGDDAKAKRLTKKLGRLTNIQQGIAKDTGNVNMNLADKMDMISRYNTVVKKIDKTSNKINKIPFKAPIKKASNSMASFKKGGSTSAFAKLAPPYNKETFADKITGAKKKKKK
jgi:hypothetical protein